MSVSVLVVHAADEQDLGAAIARPLEDDGYVVSDRGSVAVGESIVAETSALLSAGVRIVVCATAKAVGTTWCRTVINAARAADAQVIVVQMEAGAYIKDVSLGQEVVRYWEDARRAIEKVKEALGPAMASPAHDLREQQAARERYRELALKAVDIIDLAGLPELDRNVAMRQLELRSLYVPLRVRTEAGPNEAFAEAKLAELEDRRGEEKLEAEAVEGVRRFSLGERLTASRRLVVLGDPGAGKTTIIRWLATAYLLRLHSVPAFHALPDVASLPGEDLLPIIIRCRDLDAEALSGSLDDMLHRTFRKSEMSEDQAAALMMAFHQDLITGRVLLLVDGLDEIQDPGQRITFCSQLERIHIAYPETRIVATSRIVGYREMGTRMGRGFEHVTVTDLSQDDKNLFARRWCAVTEPPDRQMRATEELIAAIHSSDRIERLTGNPMLLTTMALVKRKVGRLPDGRAELYGDAVEVLLRWRNEIDEAIDHREALPQLQYIAYAMCERGAQQLREDEILELLERMREEYPRIRPLQNHTTEAFLGLLERKTGILAQAGRVRHAGEMQPVYEFRHLTIQEYLAAIALVRGRYPGRVPGVTLAEAMAPLAGLTGSDELSGDEVVVAENWRETLGLCVSVCDDDDVDDALRAIADPLPDEDPKARRPRAVLAAQCLLDEPNVSDDVVLDIVTGLCEAVEEHDGSMWASTPLTHVVRQLCRSQWEGALLGALTQAFIRTDELGRRIAMGHLVGAGFSAVHLRSPTAMRTWMEVRSRELAEGTDEMFIESALLLSGISNLMSTWPYSTPDLLACWPSVLESLVSSLVERLDDDGAVGTAALMGLLGPARRGVGAFDEEVDRALGAIIADRNAPVERRLLAIEREITGMTMEQTRRVVSALLASLGDADDRIRGAAASALRYAAELRDYPELVRLADDPVAIVREVAAEQMSADDLDALRRLCFDEIPQVRDAACQTVANLGSSATSLVGELLKADGEIPAALLRAMRFSGAEAHVPALVRLASSGTFEQRVMAIQALADAGINPEARTILRAAGTDPEPRLRAAAVRGLVDADPSMLAELAADSDETVRYEVVSAVGSATSDVDQEGILVKALGDDSPAIASRAVSLLLTRGDGADMQAVEAALKAIPSASWEEVIPFTLPEEVRPMLLQVLLWADADGRRAVVAPLMRGREVEEEDRVILSEDFDGLPPFLDPLKPIPPRQVADSAVVLGVNPAAVITRLERIALWLPLDLSEVSAAAV